MTGEPQKFVAMIMVSESLGDWTGYMDMIRELWEDAAFREGATSTPEGQKLEMESVTTYLGDGTPVPQVRVVGLAVPPDDA